MPYINYIYYTVLENKNVNASNGMYEYVLSPSAAVALGVLGASVNQTLTIAAMPDTEY